MYNYNDVKKRSTSKPIKPKYFDVQHTQPSLGYLYDETKLKKYSSMHSNNSQPSPSNPLLSQESPKITTEEYNKIETDNLVNNSNYTNKKVQIKTFEDLKEDN